MKIQLDGCGSGKKGRKNSEIRPAAPVMQAAAKNLSLPPLTIAFQLAWKNAPQRTISSTLPDMEDSTRMRADDDSYMSHLVKQGYCRKRRGMKQART
jgi:hypothetical protein